MTQSIRVLTIAIMLLLFCSTTEAAPGQQNPTLQSVSQQSLQSVAPSAPTISLPAGKVVIDPAKHLMITNLDVVEDPVRTNPNAGRRATWTFKHLMENMAGENDPAEFTLRWLEYWETDQVVNGQVSPARPDIAELIIDPWVDASYHGQLDLRLAPFKLLAIVNRMDLRVHDSRSVTTAGEGRFIFGVLDPDGMPLPFTVIFEYELLAENMRELRDWAHQWYRLGRYSLGSRGYNRALARITRRFTDAGQAPDKINGNPINQIRTNELAIGPSWELREFVLDRDTGMLAQYTVAQTPDTIALNGTPQLARLINANEAALLDGTFVLPAAWLGPGSIAGPFLPSDFPDFAKRTFTVNPFGGPFVNIPWSAANINNNEARHAFALNTCNGCHRDETNTEFLQVDFPRQHNLPESLGNEAELAAFLTGGEAVDPVDHETVTEFNDLKRRAEGLKDLLEHIQREGITNLPLEPHVPRFVH